MSIRRILVPVETADAGAAALLAAIRIAADFGATVEALHIRERPQVPPSEYYPLGALVSEEFLKALEAAAVGKAARLRQMVDETLSAARSLGASPSARWIEHEGASPADIGAAARVADLAVFGRTNEAGKIRESANLEEVLFHAGRPVIIAPAGAFASPARRILLAWNGSREAARAMAAAMPFFERAEAVGVVSFGAPGPGLASAEDAAATLRLHGATTEVIRRDKEDRDAEEFLDLARGWRADLAVMGAYSHARWRQIVLGGFTRRMLAAADLPVLMAH